jgi:fructose transport system ATP-binding protein
MDPEGGCVSSAAGQRVPVLVARGLVKGFGRVMALAGSDLELYPGEVLGIIGDNGAGKSSLVKCLSGAMVADEGAIELEGRPVRFRRPDDARTAGIETVYQSVAVGSAVGPASTMFLGRERRRSGLLESWLRLFDKSATRRDSRLTIQALGIGMVPDTEPTVETLSGRARQTPAVARAALFASKVVILDEPTAALDVTDSGLVLQLVRDLRARGVPVILVSHNLAHVFEVADRIHIQRLGRRVAVVTPQSHTRPDVVAIMNGAVTVENAA